MKIEMAESLFYSWLRHIKECQIVQTNWKISGKWELKNEDKVEDIYKSAELYFEDRYKDLFKKSANMQQVLQQGECDAIGVSFDENGVKVYTVDVAFHENGLNYGSTEVTIKKVISKIIRTAMSLLGYFDVTEGELYFASPKINPSILKKLDLEFIELNKFFSEKGYIFKVKLLANSVFYDNVLSPVISISKDVADTGELFMRSYQLYNMFSNKYLIENSPQEKKIQNVAHTISIDPESDYAELKIGKLANVMMRGILQEGKVDDEEILNLQNRQYSKDKLGINYPALVRDREKSEKVRYFADPITVKGKEYYLCSQWFETEANNDRPYLVKWINEHK